MATYEEQMDSNYAICPYCESNIHVDYECYSEDRRVEECPDCGKKFWQFDSFSVDHETSPDCELNGGGHDYQLHEETGANFCEICGKIEPF